MDDTKDINLTVQLQDGTQLHGHSPIVVLGPNGSGKTRQARTITAEVPIDFVNALRNTRVAPQIPAMGFFDARNQFQLQRSLARSQHWELTSDFDYLLSQLLAENSMAAMDYLKKARAKTALSLPPLTALGRVEEVWNEIFPGRELFWKDWAPNVKSTVTGEPTEYSANQMSDGEKAVLYLAGRVLNVDPGIIVVDEPETHLHSLLAVRLWNALEKARPDVRFVYVTHDLMFALSRSSPQFVLANPTEGLRVLNLGGDLPDDVAEVLLGSASLSFYARRVVFCEGSETGWDNEFFNAWFKGQDTVVRSVGSSEMVLRCADALRESGIANSLTSEGIVDRDYYPDEFIAALPKGIKALAVHEVESLLWLPDVVEAVTVHVGKTFDRSEHRDRLASSVTDLERHKIILERWKRRLEPKLEGVISTVKSRTESLDNIVAELPSVFDYTKWTFSPEAILKEEKDRVERAISKGTTEEIIQLIPGKKLLAIAATHLGMTKEAYISLIVRALVVEDAEHNLHAVGAKLSTALKPHLPTRSV